MSNNILIVRKLVLAILSEENQENLRAIEGSTVQWHMKKAYIDNSF
jgi:hypothetical protein